MGKRGSQPRSMSERFWEKVDKNNGPVHPLLGRCWVWTAGLNQAGYGWFAVTHGKQDRAHRIAYELLIGKIESESLDHLCSNRKCVNPKHLDPVTKAINTMRGEGACAKHARKEFCIHGHEFSEENTYYRPGSNRKHRQCRICMRETAHRTWMRNRYGTVI